MVMFTVPPCLPHKNSMLVQDQNANKANIYLNKTIYSEKLSYHAGVRLRLKTQRDHLTSGFQIAIAPPRTYSSRYSKCCSPTTVLPLNNYWRHKLSLHCFIVYWNYSKGQLMCQMVFFNWFHYWYCSEHDLKIPLFLWPDGLQRQILL